MKNIPIKRMLAIMFLIGTVAMLLGPRLWPQSPEFVFTESQHFWAQFALKISEALLFGLGIAFFMTAYPAVRQLSQTKGHHHCATKRSVYALTWTLSSWWPHDNWHLAIGHDIGSLIMIEYAFHLTVIIAGLVLAYDFLRALPLPKVVE